MSVALSRRLYTADELERLPRSERYELIEGELVPMPPPAGFEHGGFTMDIAAEAGVFIRRNNLGQGYAAETGFLIARDPDTVLAPDFAFIVRERLQPHHAGSGGYGQVVPDLVLETRSPQDRPGAVADKVRRWLEAGVRIVWEMDLRKRILTVHRPDAEPESLGPDDLLSGGDILPGFSIPLRDLLPKAEA